MSGYADVGFHELVKAGAVAGPDVVTAGYHVRPRIAEEAFLSDPSLRDLMSGVTTIAKLRRAVQMNLSHGVNWIKILATERAGTADTDPRKQVYTEEEIRAIVQEAATQERAGPGARARRRRRDGGGQGRRAQHRARHLPLRRDAAADEGERHVSRSDLHDRDRPDGAGRRLRRAGAAHPRPAHAAAAARHSSRARTARREDRHRQRHRLRAEQPHRIGQEMAHFVEMGSRRCRRSSPRRWSTPRCCGWRNRSASSRPATTPT